MSLLTSPDKNCSLCPRLVSFREANKKAFPNEWNAPVPAFGSLDSELLIVGLAPGLRGANFSGRPFTGDYAGELLYPTLLKFGFAHGVYGANKNDGLSLINARITNAVRCVPPQNKPETSEIKQCLGFLTAEIAAMKNLRVILSLGLVSHNAVLKVFGVRAAANKFAHGSVHSLNADLHLLDSYHCSRYNTNTGRLTTQMFEDVFQKAVFILKPQGA